MLKINNFKSIGEAVCYWLSYQFAIGRERLTHEASLRYPLADAITSSEISIDKIQLEKGHPHFVNKRVDIIVCNKNVRSINVDSISSIFELKLSKQNTGSQFGNEHQRVIDDILRLAYFNLATGKDAYFLICGQYSGFKNYFIGDMETQPNESIGKISLKEQEGTQPDGDGANKVVQNPWNTENSLYKDYFHFEINLSDENPTKKECTFVIVEENDGDSEELIKEKNFGLKSFQDRYISKKNDSTNEDLISFTQRLKIKTTCVSITPFESLTNRTHACGIWKIEGEI